jgi:hypothetical protein
MAKFFGVVLGITLLAFAAVAQAQAPKPISQGPDFSGLEKGQLTSGRLSPFEEKIIARMRKSDPARANEFEAQIKRKTSSIGQVSQSYKYLLKIIEQIDSEEKLYRDGFLGKKAFARSDEELRVVFRLVISAREKYASDLQKRYGPAKKTYKRAMQKFDLITASWLQKFNEASAKKRKNMGLPKRGFFGPDPKLGTPENEEKTQPPESVKNGLPKAPKEDIQKDKVKREETTTARRQGGGTGRTSAKQDPLARACPGGEWRSGTLAKIRQIETGWKKELSSSCAGTRLCRMHRGGSSFQAYMNTLIIWQCHATFVRLSKKGSDEDKKLAREEGCAIEQTLDEMAEQIKATGFMTAGASWKPLHIDMSEKWKLKDLCDTGKIEEAGSGSRNAPGPVRPVAEAKPRKDCKSSGGLVGAMNCVTKRIEGAGGSGAKTPDKPSDSASSTDKNTGVTTTSVKNPDGTRTVTRTGKDGKVLSEEKVGKSPTSASSTDRKTGVTTKSVRNPDGTRTVTKTDKDGNILSRERVGKSPDSASSTVLKTQVTTKSVANPDGSRTVTTTDKDGNVLSREKVR